MLGAGGSSYKKLRYLVERLWIMVCPKWVLTKCQPIVLDDEITYLAKALGWKKQKERLLMLEAQTP